MPRVQASSIENFVPESPLDTAWYEGEIVKAEANEYAGALKLMVQFVIQDGPTQSDDTEPLGRRVVDFIQLTGYEKFKDGGKFVKQKRFRLADATDVEDLKTGDFDTDDLIGLKIGLHVKPNQNPKTGEWGDQITDYRPAE